MGTDCSVFKDRVTCTHTSDSRLSPLLGGATLPLHGTQSLGDLIRLSWYLALVCMGLHQDRAVSLRGINM